MAEPLDPREAAALLGPLRHAAKLLIAVSGGPDSVALMRLAAMLLRLPADLPLPPLAVATVDHGLSSGSADVARGVLATAKDLGLESHLLRWEGPKPRTRVQEAARQARYALLGDLARKIGASHVATAHTLDDQAETILFRMARGSGPAGLAGMASETHQDGFVLCRPLLAVSKARLLATCRAAGWPYVEDPANRDPRFARTRLRGVMPRLAAEGLDAETLAKLGARLARDERALREMAAARRGECLMGAGPQRQVYDADALLRSAPAVALRVLDAALAGFAKPGGPRLARLETLLEMMTDAFGAGRMLRRTLHGTRITLGSDGRIELVPEGPRQRGAAAPMPPSPRLDS